MASGGNDKHVIMWDVATLAPIWKREMPNQVTSVAFCGDFVAVAVRRTAALLLDARTGADARELCKNFCIFPSLAVAHGLSTAGELRNSDGPRRR